MAGAVTDRMAETGTGMDTVVPQMLGVLGATDVLGVPGVDPDGRGAVIAALVEGRRGATEQETLAWSRVAAHVAAGYRLRRVLGKEPPVDHAEAVLRPDGKLEHAEGDDAKDAREVLHEAVRRVDRARSSRADEAEGLELWEGLVAGRWSLVDHFAGEGRRYYVAVKNPPIAQYLRGLTDRERVAVGYAACGSSHKVAAYALGIDEASFSHLVTRALAKLGVPSRAALIEVVARLGVETPEAD
jgi:DNA-binding CsgD family transcriptional regulator